MVEIQDNVEDEKSLGSEEESAAEKYIRRRGLDTSTPFTSEIMDIGYINDTDRIGVKVRTPDFDFVVNLGEHRKSLDSELINFLSECPRKLIDDGEISTDKEFDSWFSDDFRRFGFREDKKKFHVTMEDLPDLSGSISDLASEILPYYEYRIRSEDKPGIKKPISNVNTGEKDELRLESSIQNRDIEWVFDLPFQVDLEGHPVASLIEEEGNGDPRNLHGSMAYIVHRSDIVGHLDTVGYDSKKEWALVKESSYKNWNQSDNTSSKIPDSTKGDTLIFALMYISYIVLATLFLILVSEFSALLF